MVTRVSQSARSQVERIPEGPDASRLRFARNKHYRHQKLCPKHIEDENMLHMLPVYGFA